MLSKNKLKYLRSLALKKHRDAERAFVAEGRKTVDALMKTMTCRLLAGTEDYLSTLPALPHCEIITITEAELQQASAQKTPRDVIAVFEMPKETDDSELAALPGAQLCLALDTVQDPGNLGTILRLADWFGIEHVFCSHGTADAFAPKTVQATMGAIARVSVHYVNLPEFLRNVAKDVAICGTFLEGRNIYEETLPKNGIIVMGNEGSGISPEIERLVNRKLFIPPHPVGRATSESLNVAVATAITCAEFRRRH